MNQIIEEILNLPNSDLPKHDYTIYTYLDEEHKKLKSSSRYVNGNTFMNKEIFYDDEGRVAKSVEEVYYGFAMKKRHIGTNTQTFAYRTVGNEEETDSVIELFNKEKKSNTIVYESTSKYNSETKIREDVEIQSDESGVSTNKIISNFKDGIPTDYKVYVYIDGEEVKVLDQKYDEETKEYTIIEYDKNNKVYSTTKKSKCNIEDTDDMYNISTESESGEYKYTKFHLNKSNKLIRKEVTIGSKNDKFSVENRDVFDKRKDGSWILESSKMLIDIDDKKSVYDSLNEVTENYICTILPNSIYVSNINNQSTVHYTVFSSISQELSFNIEYFFKEDGISARSFIYDYGDLTSFKVFYKTNDVNYNIVCEINDKAEFIIEIYDKEENILAKHKFSLNLKVDEQRAIFNNLFNLFIKDIEDVYGKGCIKFRDQSQVILIKNTDFDTLMSRYKDRR